MIRALHAILPGGAPLAHEAASSAGGNLQGTIPLGSGVLCDDHVADGVGPTFTVSASPATTGDRNSAIRSRT